MRLVHVEGTKQKGWYAGPWNGTLPIAVGWATAGIDEPHLHQTMIELYLVAHGTATAQVERETVMLVAGDLLIVEPGEAHTFLASSPDYLHFVIHLPDPGATGGDKIAVPRAQLGL